MGRKESNQTNKCSALLPYFNPFHTDAFPKHINTISMGYSILYFKVSKFLNSDVFLFLKTVLILANSADPKEMIHSWVFHLGLHHLPKYLLTSVQNEKG